VHGAQVFRRIKKHSRECTSLDGIMFVVNYCVSLSDTFVGIKLLHAYFKLTNILEKKYFIQHIRGINLLQ